MDERTASFIQLFKRRSAWLIFAPAVVVTLLVGFGLGAMLIRSAGLLTASGINALASGCVPAGGIETAEGAEHLSEDLSAMMSQGVFASLTVYDLGGLVVGSTQGRVGEREVLPPRALDAIESGKPSTVLIRLPAGGLALSVAIPLTATPGADPYGYALAIRPLSIVSFNFAGIIISFMSVIMFGAAGAYLMVRWMVRQAERDFERQEQLVDILNDRLAGSLNELERHTLGTLQALTAAVDARDSYTAQHSLNVADYAVAIGRQLGFDDHLGLIERAGLLHDIGKIGVREATLLKPSRLSPDEYAEIKEHSRIGANIIEMIPFLQPIVEIVLHHHERWDGGGYPDAVSGEDIPQLARVLAVADAFDAMTSDRPYRSGLPLSKARRELLLGAGTQFDPKVVDALLTALDARAVTPSSGLAASA
jgi:putative nucleotidyltransferase with HDIG domain